MARSVETDLYQNQRFHLVDGTGANLDPFAGFSKVTTPDVTMDPAEYREGTFIWTRKYPGIPKVGEITLTKGVIRKNSDFYAWLLKPINGRQNYRSDLVIQEFHINDELGIQGSPTRLIKLREAFPIYFKPSSDHDASSAEVSVTELRLAVEEIDIELLA